MFTDSTLKHFSFISLEKRKICVIYLYLLIFYDRTDETRKSQESQKSLVHIQVTAPSGG